MKLAILAILGLGSVDVAAQHLPTVEAPSMGVDGEPVDLMDLYEPIDDRPALQSGKAMDAASGRGYAPGGDIAGEAPCYPSATETCIAVPRIGWTALVAILAGAVGLGAGWLLARRRKLN